MHAMQDTPDAKDLVPASHAVEFSDVSYEYTLGNPVVQNVSFAIAGGKTLALVGATGSGAHLRSPPSMRIQSSPLPTCCDGLPLHASVLAPAALPP